MFLKGRSALTDLSYLEEIIRQGTPIGVVYLDFHKFSLIRNQQLLLRLKVHGIADGVMNWTEND